MLEIDKKHITALDDAIKRLQESPKKAEGSLESTVPGESEAWRKGLATLQEKLFEAMRLEASTIPPYLTAAYSIRIGAGNNCAEIAQLLFSVAMEEMLHMMTLANMISATGKVPDLNSKNMILNWGEEPLPLAGNIIPNIERLNNGVLELFMKIEEPANPIHYRDQKQANDKDKSVNAFAVQPNTIGQFYSLIKELIDFLAKEKDPFAGGGNCKQIDFAFNQAINSIEHRPMKSAVIKDFAHAKKLIEWIVDQGEGTGKGPLTSAGDVGDLAHYYRFAEIYHKGKLLPIKAGEERETDHVVSYSEQNIQLIYEYKRVSNPLIWKDEDILRFQKNPKIKDYDNYPEEVKKLMIEISKSYTYVFINLYKYYNGDVGDFVHKSITNMKVEMGKSIPELMYRGYGPTFEWNEA